MHFTAEVDIPPEILDAQRSGNLVIFVGAGVSVDAPSSLPLFAALTARIVEDAQRSFTEAEIRDTPDLVLGLLDEQGIPVHDRVRELIDAPGSTPNRLHLGIARLFSSAGDVKIVTTNYDRHLESALRERWGDEVEVFRSPALPLGHDFAGLVYLHGSVAQDSQRLVVTDEDFGRAYLTDAWAARFVHEMFRARTVLFLGYSHSDRVMTYLARGLPRDHQGRYALVPGGDGLTSPWKGLRIRPIPYPVLTVEKESHLALTESVEAWAADTQKGLLDHASQVQQLCADQLPPVDPVSESYLVGVMKDPKRTALFVEYARGIEWAVWASKLEVVAPILIRGSVLTPSERDLAGWLAGQLVVDPDRGQPILANWVVSEALWWELARGVWQLQKSDRTRSAKWVPYLLQTATANTWQFLDYILAGCEWPDDRTVALLLADWLLAPKSSPGALSDVETVGSEHWLRDAWDRVFFPHRDECAPELMPMLVRHLETSHRVLVASGRAGPEWDSTSWGRSAIEPHEQNHGMMGGIDVLIDACRDCLVSLVMTDPMIGIGWLRTFERSDAPLVRRMAVHGWAERDDITDDQRLEWLCGRRLVWEFAGKHEVFRLVQRSLQGASLPTKQSFLDQVLAGRPKEVDKVELNEEHEAYLIYNYLVWITTSDENFDEASEALANLQAQHPNFAPRDHPDMEHWLSSGFTGSRWPWKPEELLEREPSDVLPDLLPFWDKPESPFEPGWRDVWGLVTQVVRVSPSWGLAGVSGIAR